MPVLFSTFRTLKGGTVSHWLTACGETPTRRANSFDDPAAIIANSSGVIFHISDSTPTKLNLTLFFIKYPFIEKIKHSFILKGNWRMSMTIGEQIRAARKAKGLRQHAVADQLGVTVQAVSQWERDKTVPSQLNLIKLATLLEFKVDGVELFTHAPQAGQPANYAPLVPAVATVFLNRQVIDAAELFSNGDDYAEMAPDTSEMIPFTWSPVGSVFALRVTDTSMAPDFLPGDIVIVDAGRLAAPGDFVIGDIYPSKGGMLRRYRLKGAASDGHAIVELVPTNNDYPVETIVVGKTGQISGCVTEFRRIFAQK